MIKLHEEDWLRTLVIVINSNNIQSYKAHSYNQSIRMKIFVHLLLEQMGQAVAEIGPREALWQNYEGAWEVHRRQKLVERSPPFANIDQPRMLWSLEKAIIQNHNQERHHKGRIMVTKELNSLLAADILRIVLYHVQRLEDASLSVDLEALAQHAGRQIKRPQCRCLLLIQ